MAKKGGKGGGGIPRETRPFCIPPLAHNQFIVFKIFLSIVLCLLYIYNEQYIFLNGKKSFYRFFFLHCKLYVLKTSSLSSPKSWPQALRFALGIPLKSLPPRPGSCRGSSAALLSFSLALGKLSQNVFQHYLVYDVLCGVRSPSLSMRLKERSLPSSLFSNSDRGIFTHSMARMTSSEKPSDGWLSPPSVGSFPAFLRFSAYL